jgi:hypothetical protein
MGKELSDGVSVAKASRSVEPNKHQVVHVACVEPNSEATLDVVIYWIEVDQGV